MLARKGFVLWIIAFQKYSFKGTAVEAVTPRVRTGALSSGLATRKLKIYAHIFIATSGKFCNNTQTFIAAEIWGEASFIHYGFLCGEQRKFRA